MGDPRELEWAKKPDALKESWTARIGTHVYTEFPLQDWTSDLPTSKLVTFGFCFNETIKHLNLFQVCQINLSLLWGNMRCRRKDNFVKRYTLPGFRR